MSITDYLSLSPETFLKQVPTDPKENIEFRADLHEYLAGAINEERNLFVEMCRAKPSIVFKTMYWTFQPRVDIEPRGILPFITWDWQDKAIDELYHYMLNGGKVHIKKSREVGGTWIILGCGLALWLFTPNNMGLVTSRKEELVDKKGNPAALFWKLDFMLDRLPEWAIPSFVRTDRHLENKWNSSVIDGETTTADAGRADRRDWSFCDEFPAVSFADAEGIDRALTDTAACRIYLGTSIYRSHPFSKIGRQKGVKKMAFGWWLHPFKSKGLYYSPDINKIKIVDIGYYRALYPKVFNTIENEQELTYSEIEKDMFLHYPDSEINFTADGGEPNVPKWRSPWYDKTIIERTAIDRATNLDMNEIGSGDGVFNAVTLSQMTEQYVVKPKYTGELIFKIRDDNISNIKFIEGDRGKLLWWGKLGGSRPVQNHNYVIGCDISLGQGQSNSVCSIFDVDTRIKVGRWTDSNTLPESFAEQVYAIGHWIGGMSGVPLLNWEANGIGQVFGKRIRELCYPFIYKTTSERKGFHEKKITVGWHSTKDSKLELLTNYNAAMSACFSKSAKRKFINPDEAAIAEAEDYIFSGTQLIPSSALEEIGGAKAAHGDIVIADAIANLTAQDQFKASVRFEETIPGSFAYRKKRMEEKKREKANKPKLWLDL